MPRPIGTLKNAVLNSALRKLQKLERQDDSIDDYEVLDQEEAKAVMNYIRELQDLAWKYQGLCK